MRRATALAVITLLAVGSGGCSSAPAADPVAGSSYYVSLGDSLSQGVQPDAAGVGVRTSNGYPNVHADTAGYQVIAQAFLRAAAAIRVKSATPSDSPRSDGSTPAADSTSSARDGLPAQDASAARRVLRRCANAASITANVSSRPAPAGGSRLVSATSPESTRGTGQNTVRGTCPAFRTLANHASLTDGEP